MANDLSDLNGLSSIVNFYKGKSVFLTGGIGFLGTVIVEKLLFTCKELKNIYILIKPKGNLSAEERLAKHLDTEVFHRVRKCNPEVLKKVVPIQGDLTEDNFGFSQEDAQTLLNEVSVVFHSAASLDFNQRLTDALAINTKATQRLVDFCKRIQKLQAFLYMSTAYSNSNLGVIEEKVYKTSVSLNSIWYLLNFVDKNETIIMDNIMDGRPNTYTFSKATSENLIANASAEIPATIIRPSIITAAASEPLPGWVIGWNWVNNIVRTVGKGQIKVWLGDPAKITDLIPVDYVANLSIVAAWDTHNRRIRNEKDVKVFNMTSGLQNPITIGEFFSSFLHYCRKHVKSDPYSYLLRYLIMIKYHVLFWTAFFFIETIPMYFLHVIHCIIGYKDKISIIDIHNRLMRMTEELCFFCCNQFLWIDKNVQDLHKELNEEDQKMFNFNVNEISWDSYVETYVLGLKKYLFKEQ